MCGFGWIYRIDVKTLGASGSLWNASLQTKMRMGGEIMHEDLSCALSWPAVILGSAWGAGKGTTDLFAWQV